MKTNLLLFLIMFSGVKATSQITTPTIKAGFGVDADLRANLYNGFSQSGNDDWYSNGNPGTGQFVIDTTGAAAVVAGYATDVSPYPRRMATFYRTMSRPAFSVVNNRLWMDAIFIRDYHGIDTTVFTSGSNKNGMSPANWNGGIQNIPDKNDILDMFMHVRRAGPDKTDSLWFFGGLSLDNVTGNRYFDFELYQTDIYYDRPSGKWFGYGPHAGHTAWEFDASGNVVKPGDIIFSAAYQSSSLTKIEARIWVHQSSLSINPTAFNWSGQYDGATSGAEYVYAGILPKTGGTFYTGLQCGNGEWAGPFALVLQDNSVVTNYLQRQFMEFSVNLTKLGLDPATVFGTDICGTPFNRVVVKTRSSDSFTSELKDFVAPIDLFLAPRVDAIADVPIFCGVMGVSNLQVTNPSASSIYTWSTTDGNIVGSVVGPSVTANAPGTYIVRQQLAVGCDPYAIDTVEIAFDGSCVPMENPLTVFKGSLKEKKSFLYWTTTVHPDLQHFELQRSVNNKDFRTISTVPAMEGEFPNYSFQDDVSDVSAPFVYYRLKMQFRSGMVKYSDIVKLTTVSEVGEVMLFPNPAGDQVQLALFTTKVGQLNLRVIDMSGRLIEWRNFNLTKGSNLLSLNTLAWKPGTYVLHLEIDGDRIYKKLMISRQALK